MRNTLRKIIREQINMMFESQFFQTDAAEQLAMNMSRFKLPYKVFDDSINYRNQVDAQLKNDDLLNQPLSSTTPTNIAEEKIIEGQSIYGLTGAMQQSLDKENSPANIINFGKNSQKEVDEYNDNINRALKEKPPGNARLNAISNNKNL